MRAGSATRLLLVALVLLLCMCFLVPLDGSVGPHRVQAAQYQWRTFGSGALRNISDGEDTVPLKVMSWSINVGVNLEGDPFPERLTVPADVSGIVANRVAFSVAASWSDNFPPGATLGWFEVVFQDGTRYGSNASTGIKIQDNVAEWAYDRPMLQGCLRHDGSVVKKTYDFWTNVDEGSGQYYWGHGFYAAFDIPEKPISRIELVANIEAMGQKWDFDSCPSPYLADGTPHDSRVRFDVSAGAMSLRERLSAFTGTPTAADTATRMPTETLTPIPPTATPAPPHGVGGAVPLPPAAVAPASGAPSDDSGWPAGAYAGLAGAGAAAVIVLGAGGWYAGRRRLR
jgi:hypothetical protein